MHNGMHFFECPSCLCVRTTPLDRCVALQDLIRPWEVAHLLHRRRPVLLPVPRRARHQPRPSLTTQVAKFMGREFRYVADPPHCDRWCSPAITLRDRAGDCDDLAIFAASLLIAGGVDAEVVAGNHCDHGKCGGHAWVEGWDQGGFFLLEATSGRLLRHRPRAYIPQLHASPGRCTIAA